MSGAAASVGAIRQVPSRTISPTLAAASLLNVIGILLLACCLVTAILSTDSSTELLSTQYLIANVILSTSVAISPKRGAISFVTQFFFAVFVALPAFVQVSLGVFPFGPSYGSNELAEGFVLLSIFQLTFAVFLSAPVRDKSVSVGGFHGFERPRPVPGFWILLAFLAGVCALTGPAQLFSPRFGGTESVAEAGSLNDQLLAAARSISLLVLLVMVWRRRTLSRSFTSSSTERAQLVIAILLFAILNYPAALPRFQLLGILIALALIFANFFRPMVKLLMTGGGILFLFFGFAQLKVLGGGSGSTAPASMTAIDYLVRVDFDAYKQIVDTAIYVDQGGELRGLDSFLGMLLFWLPRSIWQEKPLPAGVEVSRFLQYAYNNVSSPLPAESYLFGGYFGLVLVAALTALAISRIEHRVRVTNGNTSTFVLYAMIAGFATITLRGSLNAVAPMFLSAFLVYAAYWAADRVHSSLARSTNAR